MCKTIYKYILLTATSFGACGGLYLLCLTKWLWPYPILADENTEKEWDWRDVLIYSGLIGFIVFTPGTVIVIRSKPKELQYYGIFLFIPFVLTLVCLIIQMTTRRVHTDPDILFDLTDWYLFGVALGTLAVIVNLFLLVYEINTYGSHQLISSAKLCEENAV